VADGETQDFAGDDVGVAELGDGGKIVGGEARVEGGADAGVETGQDGIVAGEGGVGVGAGEFSLDVEEADGFGWRGVGHGFQVKEPLALVRTTESGAMETTTEPPRVAPGKTREPFCRTRQG
jgi:hypothetical protein